MTKTGRTKSPAFMMRHYGANLPRSALDPLRKRLQQEATVEMDFQEAEFRVAAWLATNGVLCSICGQHANEHGAINHAFVPTNPGL